MAEKQETDFDWLTLRDDRGRVLGKMKTLSPMLESDIQTVRQFLCDIQKGTLVMAKQNDTTYPDIATLAGLVPPAKSGMRNPVGKEKTAPDRCNMVWLSGVIRSMKVRDDGSAFVLLDPEGETKYIPLTVYDSRELARSLARFEKGDVLKVRGFVRAWSQKKDDGWRNNVEVRITEIKNEPAVRTRVAQQQPPDDDILSDDDIPF